MWEVEKRNKKNNYVICEEKNNKGIGIVFNEEESKKIVDAHNKGFEKEPCESWKNASSKKRNQPKNIQKASKIRNRKK